MWESQAYMLEKQLSILNFNRGLEAYDIVKELHKDQFRQSGEPYISHIIRVTQWILNHNIHDEDIVIGSLFHDAKEDQGYSISAIELQFGKRPATMVSLVTKEPGYDNKVYLAEIAKNAGASIIKASDRIHNISTVLAKKPEKIHKYVVETYCEYLPFLKQCRKTHGRYSHIFVEAKNIIEPMIQILAKYEGIDLTQYNTEQKHG